MKIFLIIIGVALAAGITISSMYKDKKIARIKANPKQGTAKIVSHDIPKRTTDTHYSCWINYQYEVEGKTYQHSKRYNFKIDQENYFVGLTFPMIYNTQNPDDCVLLIIDAEYQRFALQQPDSLKKYNAIVN